MPWAQVPYPLGPRRAEGQAMKWLIKAARDRKSDGSMAMKLAQEFLQARPPPADA